MSLSLFYPNNLMKEFFHLYESGKYNCPAVHVVIGVKILTTYY